MLFSEPKIPQWRTEVGTDRASHRFQCSSASRKFLNREEITQPQDEIRFSALQRAENSSIVYDAADPESVARFSALQRAENSSMNADYAAMEQRIAVSVLFSEPKIPQFASAQRRKRQRRTVSVLFSEPKFLNVLFRC